MPVEQTFEIEQYELHVSRYRVSAPSAAEAIAQLLAGDGYLMGDGTEYLGIAEDHGLSADDNMELTGALQELGVVVEDTIPSIRSVREVPASELEREDQHALEGY